MRAIYVVPRKLFINALVNLIVKENLSEAGFKYFKELPLVENNLGIHEET